MNAGSAPDPRQVYALSIGPPKPDFQLLATFKMLADPDPSQALMSAPILRPGGTQLTIVQAYRRAGFDGEITVTADHLPSGVVCLPAVIAAGQNQTILGLAADESAAMTSVPLKIIGRAAVGDQELRRAAFFSTVVWDKHNANELTHARIRHDVRLSVIEDTKPLSISLLGDASQSVAQGGKLSLPIQVTRREGVTGALTIAARGLPKGITAAALSVDANSSEATLEITLEGTAPLGSHTFYLAGQSKVTYRRNPQAAAAAEVERARFGELIVRLTEATSAATKATENLAAAQTQSKLVNQRAIDLAAAAQPRDIDVFVQSLPVTLLVEPVKDPAAAP